MATSPFPRRVAVDANFLIRSLSPTEFDPVCRSVFDAMVRQPVDILIPAPAYAEVVRDSAAIPVLPNIIVVAFDEATARTMNSKLPPTVWKVAAAGHPRQVVKVDAQIVACAIHNRAALFLCGDGAARKLAATVGLPAHDPADNTIASRVPPQLRNPAAPHPLPASPTSP